MEEKGKSIWDQMPEEWLTDPDSGEKKPEGKAEPEPAAVKEPEPEEKDTGDIVKAPETGNADAGSETKTREEADSGDETPENKADARKKEKKKLREFRRRNRENKDDVPEYTRQAYREEKEKNRRDFLILGIVGAAVIIGLIICLVLFTENSTQKIYDLVDQGNYSIAYQKIQEAHEDGENVDELVYYFSERCVNDSEYKRAVAVLPLLSSDADRNGAFFSSLIEDLQSHDKANRVREVLDFMYSRGNELKQLADELSKKYGY